MKSILTKCILMIVIFLSIHAILNAQQLIKVSVFDSLTKEPLENITIQQFPLNISGQSDKNGCLQISNKTIAIIVSYIGYCSKKVFINDDSVIVVYISRSNMQLKDVIVKNETRLSTYKVLSTINLNLQIAYTTRLKNETQLVEQISYTPGVPFYTKFKRTVFF